MTTLAFTKKPSRDEGITIYHGKQNLMRKNTEAMPQDTNLSSAERIRTRLEFTSFLD